MRLDYLRSGYSYLRFLHSVLHHGSKDLRPSCHKFFVNREVGTSDFEDEGAMLEDAVGRQLDYFHEPIDQAGNGT